MAFDCEVCCFISGFETLSKKNGKIQYRCKLCGTRPCYKKNISAHLKSASHKNKHAQMSEILSASSARSQMPHSYSLPHGDVELTTDLIMNEAMVSGFDLQDAPPSEDSDLEESDPAKFGLASSVGSESDLDDAVSFTMSDWLSDMSENEQHINELVESLDKTIHKCYHVQVDSLWYPFPNKEVSLPFSYV